MAGASLLSPTRSASLRKRRTARPRGAGSRWTHHRIVRAIAAQDPVLRQSRCGQGRRGTQRRRRARAWRALRSPGAGQGQPTDPAFRRRGQHRGRRSPERGGERVQRLDRAIGGRSPGAARRAAAERGSRPERRQTAEALFSPRRAPARNSEKAADSPASSALPQRSFPATVQELSGAAAGDPHGDGPDQPWRALQAAGSDPAVRSRDGADPQGGHQLRENSRASVVRPTRSWPGCRQAGRLFTQLTEGVADGLVPSARRARRCGSARGIRSGGSEDRRIRIALVAVQTTMLAVSGSVEAARAGELGEGFALVSTDIRRTWRATPARTQNGSRGPRPGHPGAGRTPSGANSTSSPHPGE